MGITKDQLNNAQKLWDSAPVPEKKDFDEIPDGKYRAELVEGSMESREVKTEQRLQISLQWKIVGPTHEGRRVFQNIGLDTEKGAEIAKGTFSVLGQTLPKKVSEIGAMVEGMKGTVAEINLRHGKASKTNGKSYQNVYVNKLVTDEDEGVDTETETQDLSELELVGQSISFEYDGNTVIAKVTKQDTDELTAEDEGGEVYNVSYDEVTLVEDDAEADTEEESAPEDEVTIEVGSRVIFDVAGDTISGEVKSIDDDVAKVKRDDTGKIRKVPIAELALNFDTQEEEAEPEVEEESTEEESTEEEAAIEVGSKVQFDVNGDTVTGEVLSIDDDVAKVKRDDTSKVRKVPITDLTPAVEAEEEVATTEDSDVEYIGKTVKFKADGTAHTGKVVADDNDGHITVIDDSGEEWTMEYADVTIIGEAEEAEAGAEEAEVAPKKAAKVASKKTVSSGRVATTKKTVTKTVTKTAAKTATKAVKKKTRRV